MLDFKYILKFWFNGKNKKFWFLKDPKFDKEIIQKFLHIYDQALKNQFKYNKNNVYDILSIIILFDQFPRNMFRNSSKSYNTDSIAISLTKHTLENKLDQQLKSEEEKLFLYMPLMHSENLEDQDLCVKLLEGNVNAYKYAIMHRDIIKKFGRFPHRNNILGRESTIEEIEFLSKPNSSF